MIEYKLLTKDDLIAFMDFYDELSVHEDYKWQLDLTLNSLSNDIPEIYTAAEIVDGKILSTMIGYTVNVIWDRFLFNRNMNLDFVPEWVMGLWVSRHTVKGLPHQRGDELATLLSDKFIELGRTSFYVARKVRNRVNYQNALDYILRFNRNVQYQPSIEKIMYGTEYDRSKHSFLYRIISHNSCEVDKCIVIVRYSLKNEHRI